jgi:hypothetical protein
MTGQPAKFVSKYFKNKLQPNRKITEFLLLSILGRGCHQKIVSGFFRERLWIPPSPCRCPCEPITILTQPLLQLQNLIKIFQITKHSIEIKN